MISEQVVHNQVVFLMQNAVETKSGRYICFYNNILLVAETPVELAQLLNCIWR